METKDAWDELEDTLADMKEKVIEKLNTEHILSALEQIMDRLDAMESRMATLEARPYSAPITNPQPIGIGDSWPYGNHTIYCGTTTKANISNDDLNGFTTTVDPDSLNSTFTSFLASVA